MKEFITEYWLTIIVCVYLLAMVLHGHYKGFIRIAVSMVALVAALIIVRVGMPHVTRYLKENTALHQMVEDSMLNLSGFQDEPAEEDIIPAGQRQLIEQMNLPEPLKEALIENNNSEVYQILGVEVFSEYIGNYLSNIVFNIIGFILLFLFSYIVIRLIMRWLDLVAKLPIIYGINQIAGAILGGLEGLAVLWFLSLIVTVCSGTSWGRIVIAQIEASSLLTFLYRNNIFQWFVMSVLSSMF